MTNSAIPPKLIWACRRGMLELDVLLGNYLKEVYPVLPIAEQEQFVAFLDNSDQEMYTWLIGHKDPSDPKNLDMTHKIRDHAKNRH